MLFLQVSLVENWLIFVTRGASTWPSWKLVGAIFVVDVLSTIFCVFGWLIGNPDEYFTDPHDHYPQSSNGQTSIVTVIVIWGYSIGVIVVVAIVYFVLVQVKWIDNLGRARRSRADTQMENILAHLSRIALEHETDAQGKGRWVLGNKATVEEEEE
jgi:H+-transporting ATPase